jgi:hypothetical protein
VLRSDRAINGYSPVFFRKGSPTTKKERKKEARVWENGGTRKEATTLDYSGANGEDDGNMRKDETEEVETMVCKELCRIVGYTV